MGFVMENMSLVSSHGSFALDLKIKNHAAMAALTKGQAARADIDTLVAMVNIVEALYRLGFGKDYSDVVRSGLDALKAVGSRGAATSRFILRAEEMKALNTMIELHDAQLEVITLKDMDAAIALVYEEIRLKKLTPIIEHV